MASSRPVFPGASPATYRRPPGRHLEFCPPLARPPARCRERESLPGDCWPNRSRRPGCWSCRAGRRGLLSRFRQGDPGGRTPLGRGPVPRSPSGLGSCRPDPPKPAAAGRSRPIGPGPRTRQHKKPRQADERSFSCSVSFPVGAGSWMFHSHPMEWQFHARARARTYRSRAAVTTPRASGLFFPNRCRSNVQRRMARSCRVDHRVPPPDASPPAFDVRCSTFVPSRIHLSERTGRCAAVLRPFPSAGMNSAFLSPSRRAGSTRRDRQGEDDSGPADRQVPTPGIAVGGSLEASRFRSSPCDLVVFARVAFSGFERLA